ncbi:hypothetical protein BC940DRAFT_365804 [Gongronella butleri]|nr:hypothetical protein BC940DRAFT_365804 [Gongronella butleri]
MSPELDTYSIDDDEELDLMTKNWGDARKREKTAAETACEAVRAEVRQTREEVTTELRLLRETLSGGLQQLNTNMAQFTQLVQLQQLNGTMSQVANFLNQQQTAFGANSSLATPLLQRPAPCQQPSNQQSQQQNQQKRVPSMPLRPSPGSSSSFSPEESIRPTPPPAKRPFGQVIAPASQETAICSTSASLDSASRSSDQQQQVASPSPTHPRPSPPPNAASNTSAISMTYDFMRPKPMRNKYMIFELIREISALPCQTPKTPADPALIYEKGMQLATQAYDRVVQDGKIAQGCKWGGVPRDVRLEMSVFVLENIEDAYGISFRPALWFISNLIGLAVSDRVLKRTRKGYGGTTLPRQGTSTPPNPSTLPDRVVPKEEIVIDDTLLSNAPPLDSASKRARFT